MIVRTTAALTAGFCCLAASAAAAALGPSEDSTRAAPRSAEVRVATVARLADAGWRVDWNVRVRCPPGRALLGRALIAERDPSAIPALAGEDQGITAVLDLDGSRRCTGRWQRLHLVLRVRDTVVIDPVTGTTQTFHEPLHRTPPARTTAAVDLRSPESVEDGGFVVGFCAAPNCAEETGPRITIR